MIEDSDKNLSKWESELLEPIQRLVDAAKNSAKDVVELKALNANLVKECYELRSINSGFFNAVSKWLSERDNPAPCLTTKRQAEQELRELVAKVRSAG